MAALATVNALTEPGHWWVAWPAWVWGLLLVAHVGWTLALGARLLGAHAAVFAVANLGFLAIDLADGGAHWALWPLWGWGMLLAAHAAARLVRGARFTAAHVTLFALANLGFVAIDLADGGADWYYWPLLGWGILLAAHAGLVVTGRDEVVVGPAIPGTPVERAPGPPPVPVAASGAAPGAMVAGVPARGRARTGPRGFRVAEVVLALIAGAQIVAAAGTGLAWALTVRGSGVAAAEARPVAPFQALVVRGEGEVVVEQGEVDALTVEGDDNLVPLVKSSVEDGTLTIDAGQHWLRSLDPSLPLRYRVTVRDLTSLELVGNALAKIPALTTERLTVVVDGTGVAELGALRATSLDASVDGTGRLAVDGMVTDQVVRVDGSGSYDASGLSSRVADVTVDGTGAANVSVSERLVATVDGSGLITYGTDADGLQLVDTVDGSGEIAPTDPNRSDRYGFGAKGIVVARRSPRGGGERHPQAPRRVMSYHARTRRTRRTRPAMPVRERTP